MSSAPYHAIIGAAYKKTRLDRHLWKYSTALAPPQCNRLDNHCGLCNAGFYLQAGASSAVCTPQPTCPANHYRRGGSVFHAGTCTVCDNVKCLTPGTARSGSCAGGTNGFTCVPSANTCPTNTYLTAGKCESCPFARCQADGTFRVGTCDKSTGGGFSCKGCTVCADGSYATTPCGETAADGGGGDAVCATCAPGMCVTTKEWYKSNQKSG